MAMAPSDALSPLLAFLKCTHDYIHGISVKDNTARCILLTHESYRFSMMFIIL
jgi:hypothetical protein